MRRILFLYALLGLIVAGCATGSLDGSIAIPSQTVTASTEPATLGITPTTPPRVAATPTSPSRTTRTPTSAPTSFASRALAQTNSYRSQFNCPPLHENAQLEQAALAHSEDMALHGYFDHNSPSGQTPWDRIHAAGYQFSMAAENIAAGYPTPEAVIDAFFNETPPNDGHRRNLLNCGLRDVGFAYFYQKGSPYSSYWTQDFATPL
jgi:uncharacterized protein YkwD